MLRCTGINSIDNLGNPDDSNVSDELLSNSIETRRSIRQQPSSILSMRPPLAEAEIQSVEESLSSILQATDPRIEIRNPLEKACASSHCIHRTSHKKGTESLFLNKSLTLGHEPKMSDFPNTIKEWKMCTYIREYSRMEIHYDRNEIPTNDMLDRNVFQKDSRITRNKPPHYCKGCIFPIMLNNKFVKKYEPTRKTFTIKWVNLQTSEEEVIQGPIISDTKKLPIRDLYIALVENAPMDSKQSVFIKTYYPINDSVRKSYYRIRGQSTEHDRCVKMLLLNKSIVTKNDFFRYIAPNEQFNHQNGEHKLVHPTIHSYFLDATDQCYEVHEDTII